MRAINIDLNRRQSKKEMRYFRMLNDNDKYAYRAKCVSGYNIIDPEEIGYKKVLIKRYLFHNVVGPSRFVRWNTRFGINLSNTFWSVSGILIATKEQKKNKINYQKLSTGVI